jgi:isopentenyl-diphosphate Delta-isomerase
MSSADSSGELFDVFDETNQNLIAVVPRGQVHATGQFHRAVNVLLFNSENQVLLQKRMHNKDVCPNAWDVSVCVLNSATS